MQGGGADAPSLRGRILLTTCVAGAVVIADQVTKTIAEDHFATHPVSIGPIHLVEVLNTGVAFSLGVGHPVVAGVVATVVAVAIGAWGLTRRFVASQIAASLVVGGAISNLADRVVRHHHGAVIDWIQLPLWPVFNLADAAITVGVVVLALSEVRGHRG